MDNPHPMSLVQSKRDGAVTISTDHCMDIPCVSIDVAEICDPYYSRQNRSQQGEEGIFFFCPMLPSLCWDPELFGREHRPQRGPKRKLPSN